LCLPDESYGAIACSIFTFEQDEIKYYSWMNTSTTEFPEMDMSMRLKDNLWGKYTAEHEGLIINADQSMQIS